MTDLQDPFPPPPRPLGLTEQEAFVYETLYRHCLPYLQEFIRQGLMEDQAVRQINLLCPDFNWLIFYLVPKTPLGVETFMDSLAEKEGSDGLYAEVDEDALNDAGRGLSINYYIVMAPNGWYFLLAQNSNVASQFYNWLGAGFFDTANNSSGLIQEEASAIRNAPVYTD